MDIIIHTSEAESIDTAAILRAVEALGYFVNSVTFAGEEV